MKKEKTKSVSPVSGEKSPKRSIFMNVFFYLFLGVVLFTFFSSLNKVEYDPARRKPISEVIKLINEGLVEKIEVDGSVLIITPKVGEKYVSLKEDSISFDQFLVNNNVDKKKISGGIDIKQDISWMSLLTNIAQVAFPIIFILFLFRQFKGAGGDVFSFGKSRAKLFAKDSSSIKFSDVAGSDEAKGELIEIVDFLKNPAKYRALGARIPRGVLLVGAAGVGKTLLAKAVAGEANVPFFSVAGSEFMEMLVGVGSSRVRDLFEMAKASQPSLIFIDEIDAIGRQRGMGIGGGHDEREQTLNQILVEMDGFDPRSSVIVLAASVTGDTPILVKENEGTKLSTISEVVDKYYEPFEEGVEVKSEGLKALSFTKIGSEVKSKFVDVRGVFRHKVSEIFEIKYLGGAIKATGNHSVFVWEKGEVIAKPVTLLKKGDVLVDITPKNITAINNERKEDFDVYLKVYKEDENLINEYEYAMVNKNRLSQQEIAESLGFAQTTISLWHRGINIPRGLSRNYFKHDLPEEVKVTPELMRLFGYYTAEGYARKEIDFCFNEKEIEYIKDVKKLMLDNFGLEPQLERHATKNAVNIIYQSVPVARLFETYCGSGSRNKHVPPFLFEAPYNYFLEYLRGLSRGDGYISKDGKLEITSVSKRLITELVWVSRIFGIKAYSGSFKTKAGRTINGGKPLSESIAYRYGTGKYYNPFNNLNKEEIKRSPRRPVIREITKKPFDGYVYDLCGCSNEAFFGGDSPVLLHNTNRPDMLDAALVRPGRFDRRVVISLPDIKERAEIIKIHMRGKPFHEHVNIDKIAKRTVGFSGADLENMLNEAAILAARNGKKEIDSKDLEESTLKVQLGPEKKKMQSEEDRRIVAYHEAGHAIAAYYVGGMDPVHRISIISRGMSLGFTLFPPTMERYNETKSRLLAMITTSLGGRAAEEIVFKEQTVGASNDIEKATEIARKMVTEFGMSDLGPISFDSREGKSFFSWQIGEGQKYSNEVAAKIDSEIKRIIDTCYMSAKNILLEHREKLNLVSEELVQKETLDAEEFEALMKPSI